MGKFDTFLDRRKMERKIVLIISWVFFPVAKLRINSFLFFVVLFYYFQQICTVYIWIPSEMHSWQLWGDSNRTHVVVICSRSTCRYHRETGWQFVYRKANLCLHLIGCITKAESCFNPSNILGDNVQLIQEQPTFCFWRQTSENAYEDVLIYIVINTGTVQIESKWVK